MQAAPPPPPAPSIELDPLALLVHASGPVMFVNWTLVAAAIAVWIVLVLKLRELGRMRAAERRFEEAAKGARSPDQLHAVALGHPGSPGARVALAMLAKRHDPALAEAESKRAIVLEEQRAGALLSVLSIVGSAGPFVGLFGTVWGILDAFLRIGREKSASLPVVAPAIGEALISTAAGLFAAIPAVVAFNIASKRADDLLARVEAAAGTWLVMLGRGPAPVTASAKSRPVESFPPPDATPGGVVWAPR